MYDNLSKIPYYDIDPKTLDNIWRWLLWRQGVAADNKNDSVYDIAHKSLGLHAARLPSPFATVMARSSSDSTPKNLLDITASPDLMTIRCMRKTLHTLPVELATVAHGATRHFRERDALRYAFNLNVDAKTLNKVILTIISLLETKVSASHRELEMMLCGNTITTHQVRAALKVAWEKGMLVYRNSSGAWDKEKRTFALITVVHPTFDPDADRKSSTNMLVHHYFDRYGPATIKDAMWWSGLSRSAITEAILLGNDGWVRLGSSWSDSPLYMLKKNLELFEREFSGNQFILNFLAHEDVALKAYFETRKRYLGNLKDRYIFNQIGEVLPSIIHDGKIVGKWSWNKKTMRIESDLFDYFDKSLDYSVIRQLEDRYAAQLKDSTARPI